MVNDYQRAINKVIKFLEKADLIKDTEPELNKLQELIDTKTENERPPREQLRLNMEAITCQN